VEKKDLQNKIVPPKPLPDRFQASSGAAVLGAFASFVAAAFRPDAVSGKSAPQNNALVHINFAAQKQQASSVQLPIEYAKTPFPGSALSDRLFRESLLGIAIDSENRISLLGDGEVRIIAPDGKTIRTWKAPQGAQCLAAGSGGRIFFGVASGIEIYNNAGIRIGGFAVGEPRGSASVTAVKIHGSEILVADAAARSIRRYDANGKQLGSIGNHGKVQGFILPNRSLDMAVDAHGAIHATDSGRHRISSWTLDGSLIGSIGKFGQMHPEDFVGCCNPVNIAIARDGKIVTAEKVIARVKVYGADGKLLALIGPEHFNPKCTHLHLAVDSKDRIFVGDPVSLTVQIFSPKSQPGAGKNV
jgi:hypothetical protein